LDFVFASVVERVVHNRSLLLERILGVNGVGTSSGETAANNGRNNNSDKNTSTDGGGDGGGAGEKVGTGLNVVSASVVCALELVTTTNRGLGRVVRLVSVTRITWFRVGLCRSFSVVQTEFGVFAGFGFVLASKCRIARVHGTIIVIIAVDR